MSDYSDQNGDPDLGFVKHKAKQMLRMLQNAKETDNHWINTHDFIPIAHYVPGCMDSLRRNGWIIDTRRKNNGTWEWLLVGRTDDLRKLPAATKDLYYKTKHWQKKREERLAFDSRTCCFCHTFEINLKPKDYLEVHHWRYDLFREALEHLTTLCVGCHKQVHANVKIKFPKQLDVESYITLMKEVIEMRDKGEDSEAEKWIKIANRMNK